MKITLVRHGLTGLNAAHRYCGSTDDALCEEGILAAQAIPQDNGQKTVYVSPLCRARQTAAILYPKAEQVVVPGFREMDFGVFEGKTSEELSADSRYQAWLDADCMPACPDGESQASFSARIGEAFTAFVREREAEGVQHAVIVAHGGTIMALMDRFAEEKRGSYYNWYVKNLDGFTAEVNMKNGGLLLSRITPLRPQTAQTEIPAEMADAVARHEATGQTAKA